MMGLAQGAAARALTGAHALTDVTGFGLAGHLMAICEASGVGARLDLAAVPVFAGAEALAAAGVRSTLFPANRAALEGRFTGPDTPRTALLFDPQTAGGLLAAVPEAEAAALVEAIRATGLPAARIGAILDAPPGIAAA
jgi:selenide,water dikinase